MPRFTVNDFVVVRKAQNVEQKLSFKLQSPRRIVATVSPLVHVVEQLGSTRRREKVHCTRPFRYDGGLDGVNVPEEVLELADCSEAKHEILGRILDIGLENSKIWLQLQWEGLPDVRDYTWSALQDIFEDVQDMVMDSLKTTPRRQLAEQAARQLGISK